MKKNFFKKKPAGEVVFIIASRLKSIVKTRREERKKENLAARKRVAKEVGRFMRNVSFWGTVFVRFSILCIDNLDKGCVW